MPVVPMSMRCGGIREKKLLAKKSGGMSTNSRSSKNTREEGIYRNVWHPFSRKEGAPAT